MKTVPCAVCKRQTTGMSESWHQWECSHVSCPSRRHAWSDFDNRDFEQTESLPESESHIERLFDQP